MSTRFTYYIVQEEIAIDKFRSCDVVTEVCDFENIFTLDTTERNLKQKFPIALHGFFVFFRK